MALSQSSTCSQVSTLVHAELARPQSPKSQTPATATPLKADMASFQGASALRSTGPQTRSMAAPKVPQASSVALKELAIPEETAENKLVSQVSEDFEEVVESVVESVVEDPASTMRVRKSSGKSATRTSRRRALVMCLALGMVRPCASNVTGGMGTGSIRRTASSGLRRSASSSFTVSGNLSSQVSIASSLKAANLLEDKEDESAKL